MKKVLLGVLLGALILALVAIPALAAYWAYITVEESGGNDYTDLPVLISRNVTQLVAYDIITSTGLDTRVLTGEGVPLPHMLANDRIAFVTDLAAYEDKTLIFYTGATSLSSFPIVIGHGGYITTDDDPDLELTYVLELLASGYFDASAGAGKNILYKQDAFKMNISAANTLRVAALEAGDAEQWEMHYSSFTSGVHTIYVVTDGMQAHLYVDTFLVAKDTANLWANANVQMTATATAYNLPEQSAGYANGRFWCFYMADTTHFGWRSSTDGDSWDVEQTVALDGADAISGDATAVYYRGNYVHLSYQYSKDIMYRRGLLNANGTISWSDVWQTAVTETSTVGLNTIAVDVNGYPFITYREWAGVGIAKCTKASTNDGTWATAGGYPFYINAYNDGVAKIAAYYNNDDMYLMYINNTAGGHTLQGNYYNGSAWGGLHTIDTSTYEYRDWDATSDSEGNLYVVWFENMSPNGYDCFLKVRYSDGTWESPTKIADGTSYLQQCSITYNPDTDCVYIFYNKEADAKLYGSVFVLALDTIIGPYTFSSAPGNIGFLESSAYSENVGITTYGGANTIAHQYLTYVWAWNDNLNDWRWMQNNCMPYADSFQIAIDGTLELEYQPETIIQSSILPDISEASGHDGTITWGTNPADVDAEIGLFHSDSPTPPGGTGASSPGWTDPLDMMGPTGQPGWTPGLPELATNPFYPLMNAIAGLTDVPVGIVWIIVATIILFFAMLLAYKYLPHLIMTALVGGGVAAFWVHMGIYPFWIIFIFVAAAIGIIMSERMPSVG